MRGRVGRGRPWGDHQPLHCPPPTGSACTPLGSWPCRNAVASSPATPMSALWERSTTRGEGMQATDGCGEAELKYSEAAVELSLGPSRLAAALLCAMAFATLAVLAATPGGVAARILLATAVACAALECAHRLGAGRGGRRGLRL